MMEATFIISSVIAWKITGRWFNLLMFECKT